MYRQNLSRLLRGFPLSLALISLCGLAAEPAGQGTPEAAPWRHQISRDGITVDTRPVAGSPYAEFRAETVIHAPIGQVLAALDDTPACPMWIHRCLEARIVEQQSGTERIIQQVTQLPFPVNNRDVVLRVTLEADGADVLIKLEALPDHIPAQRGLVRVRDIRGHYRVIAVGTSTRLIWQQFVDPAGRIPAFLAKSMQTEMPLDSLTKLREWVNEPRYAGYTLIRDDAGQPLRLERTGPGQAPNSDR